MRLRRIILLTSLGVTGIAKLEVYEAPSLAGRQVQGYWVADLNRIVLSPEMYGEFTACDTQKAQSMFCAGLTMITQLKLADASI